MSNIALLEEISQCRACEDRLDPRPVLQAYSDAKILIAGQAPGLKVHESGIPFNDASGDRLRDWLGVSSGQFYDPDVFAIVPMAFCYPGRGRSGDIPPPKLCAELWRDKVLQSLANISLSLAIGNHAQAYHFPDYKKQSATELLKAWLTTPDSFGACVPLPHPSPRNNIWLKKNPWFEHESLPLIKERIKNALSP